MVSHETVDDGIRDKSPQGPEPGPYSSKQGIRTCRSDRPHARATGLSAHGLTGSPLIPPCAATAATALAARRAAAPSSHFVKQSPVVGRRHLSTSRALAFPPPVSSRERHRSGAVLSRPGLRAAVCNPQVLPTRDDRSLFHVKRPGAFRRRHARYELARSPLSDGPLRLLSLSLSARPTSRPASIPAAPP